MGCPIYSKRFETIPDRISDKSLKLYPYHNVLTHLGCALMRTAIGISLINPKINSKKRNSIIFVMIMAMIVFGMKYLYIVIYKDTPLWKSYLRMLVAYSSALCLISMGQNQFAGVIVIADALMGMNSRHTASVITCGMK